ncbi:MAG: hypothetical protein ACJAXF_002990 [Polaribacter sp.]|jgi:hypothetical protein
MHFDDTYLLRAILNFDAKKILSSFMNIDS